MGHSFQEHVRSVAGVGVLCLSLLACGENPRLPVDPAADAASSARAPGDAASVDAVSADTAVRDAGTDEAPAADAAEVVFDMSDPNRVAGVLARVLWGAPASPDLVRAVGGARSQADLRALALSMLSDARARSGVGAFYRWWLDVERLFQVDKERRLFPGWGPDVARAMVAEAESFAVAATLDQPRSWDALMTGAASFADGRVATAVGDLGVDRRGVLAQPALLAAGAGPTDPNPVMRGVFVADRVLCRPLDPPPADVDVFPSAPLPPTATNRERYRQHAQNPACAKCHDGIDPFGFAFEGYDAIGRVRTRDHGRPIDASGAIPNGAAPIPFADAAGLARGLAGMDEARRCMARQWFRFARGPMAAEPTPALLDRAVRALADADGNLRALIADVVASAAATR